MSDFDVFAAGLGPKRKPLREIVRRDRRELAARLQWPDGAVEVCERIDREHAGWTVSWLPAGTVPGHERPACFWARREWPRHEVHAADEDELVAGIRQAPPASSWDLRPLRG